MEWVWVAVVIVLVLAVVQVRRRGSRLMRPDNAPPPGDRRDGPAAG